MHFAKEVQLNLIMYFYMQIAEMQMELAEN